MKLKFQTWVGQANFPVNATHLLETAIICYKTEVYTAALLMSYLGLLTLLKDRVMTANKPSLFPEREWEKILRNLRNEDKWESEIFDVVIRQEKLNSNGQRERDPVFLINENLRTQFRYWRDRRNDVAHHKDNAITGAHVEAFWNFIESNLSKITVEGGKATLLNKFKRHFDTTYTPKNEDYSHLIREIKVAIEKIDLAVFWDDLFEEIGDLFDYTNEMDVIKSVLQFNDDEMTESIVTFLKLEKNKNLQADYLSNYPSHLGLLKYGKQEIRSLWMKKLVGFKQPLRLYASMLRNGLIPSNEINEANEKMATLYSYVEDLEDHDILMKNGFGEVLYGLLFVTNNPRDFHYWKFMNKHSYFFTQYIEMYPLKDEVVKIVHDEMSKSEWRSHFLENSLNMLFERNLVKKQEFKDRLTGLGLDWPVYLE